MNFLLINVYLFVYIYFFPLLFLQN